MVDIVGVNSSTTQPARVSDRSVAKGGSAKSKGESVSSASSDRLDISTGGKEVKSVVDRLIVTAQAEPDIRPEEVSRAKERLDNGDYNGIEVSRQTAKKILGLD